jgi:putative Mg2+ transporter-C (MgtC) family protein
MDILWAYWQAGVLTVNVLLMFHLVGAALLGLLVGYERSYHGRAAGMRTYALVCMASAMLTVINGFPAQWFGGLVHVPAAADPTRVIQGIMTGIGFLGAGVIIKEGFTIRGLSTSASIWMTATIGILLGVGFYGAAIISTLATMAVMSGFRRLEDILPHQTLYHLDLTFAHQDQPDIAALRQRLASHGFDITNVAYHFDKDAGRLELGLILRALGNERSDTLAASLVEAADIKEFRLTTSHS